MKGITFGQHHSFRDFRLILGSKEMGSPTVKTRKIDIEGADGVLDLTDFFGEPKYEEVTHKFHFYAPVPFVEHLPLFSSIKNAIHGKKKRIILDDDPLSFYLGRCYVSGFTDERGIGKIDIECECEPWKYRLTDTVVTQTVTGTADIVLTNARKRAVPLVEIETTGNLRLVYGVAIWDLGAGSYTLPELELQAGDNTVTVTGEGTIRFTWKEADL